ncbi:MAG: glycosyltransferase family 4 protein [Planctomycetaceae bacterium]|nr:glycosyltransferase family 4 protein [Planctomycetaceae bacterium]
MRVALIETSAPDAPGSMRRYANLIEQAFAEDSAIEITRLSVAPSRAALKRIPKKFQNWGHHALVTWNTRRICQPGIDLFHIVDGSHAYIAKWLPGERTIATAHDIIPYLQSQGRFPVPAPGRLARWLINSGLKGLGRVAEVSADSQSTANDLKEHLPASTALSVCPLTIEPSFLTNANLNPRGTKARPFLFHIGNNGFYKNRAGVIDVFARLRRDTDCDLVLAGPAPLPGLRQQIQHHGLTEHVTFLVDPDDSSLAQLYREASLLLFPSVYEGFGWPPLEAMAMGCPVVCSDAASLPEVAGDAALTSPHNDLDQLAHHCRRILTDTATASDLQRRGRTQAESFSLPRFHDQLAEIYQRVHTAAGGSE